MSAPYILVPKTLLDSMLSSSSIAEPDVAMGEVIWNAATSYIVGQLVILVATHRVYQCLIAGVNATSPHLSLTGTTPRWQDIGPTNRWAAYDGEISTASTQVSSVQWVLRPGIITAICCYGLQGGGINISYKDAPGGTVVRNFDQALYLPPVDFWDYRFGGVRQRTKALCADLTPYVDAEVTITVTADGGGTAKVGMIAFGDLRTLVGQENRGGTQYDASVKPISSSYVAFDAFKKLTIKRRPSTTDMQISVVMPIEDANPALSTMQEVLDVPVAIIGSDFDDYSGLNVFGLTSSSLSYPGPKRAQLNIDVIGLI